MAQAKAAPQDRALEIRRVFAAPRALVFKLWTAPEHVVRWWGPQGFTTPFCEMDVKPSGRWRICMRSAEGKDYWQQGVFREVVPPERLVFSYAFEDEAGKPGHEMEVAVSFAERGDKTEMVLRQAVFETVEDRDGHVEGWASCLDILDEYIRTLSTEEAVR